MSKILPEDDKPMGFLEHLEELRVRLVRALMGLVPAVAVAWIFRQKLMAYLAAPLMVSWKNLHLGDPKLHFAHVTDPFMAYVKLSIIIGVLISSPWLFLQVWGFISPGLYKHEKRFVIPFVLISTLFFLGGAYFGYRIVFPLGLQTLLEFGGQLPEGNIRLEPTLMIGDYLDFSFQMLLAFGVVFEVPVVISFLALVGMVTWRQLLKFSRYWVVIATVLSAILTPPDVSSQLMMLVPLIALYFVSILMAIVLSPRDKTA